MGKFQNMREVELIMHLLFSYPSKFFETEFKKYFYEYKSTSPFLPFVDDEKQFKLMRHRVLGEPTPRQTQVQQSSATADIDNDQTDEQVDQNNNAKAIRPQVDILSVHYTHEKRFQSFKRDMHHLHNNIFGLTPAAEAKLTVGTSNRRDSTNE